MPSHENDHVWLHHTLETPKLGSDGHIDWNLAWLYRRKRGVRELRPVFTGDVYYEITPIGEEGPATVVILQHPCALQNADNELRDILLAAKVVDHAEVPVSQWTGNYDIMPLVISQAKPPSYQAIDFNQLALVRTADLRHHKRGACMEIEAIAVLLQRWVNVSSRVIVPRWRFEQIIEPVRRETEGIENWCTERIRAGVRMPDAIREATQWLDVLNEDTGVPRRESFKTHSPGRYLVQRMQKVAKEMSEHQIAETEQLEAEGATPTPSPAAEPDSQVVYGQGDDPQ